MARKVYNLETDFNLNYTQSAVQLFEIGPLSDNIKKYPKAYERLTTGLGWSDDKFQSISAFDAAFLEATWQGQGGGQPINGYLASANHVIIPHGTYRLTIPAEVSFGLYKGYGAGYSDVNNSTVNTKLEIWHEKWNGDPSQRHCIQSSTWGKTGNLAYVEGTRIENIRLRGRSMEFAGQKFESSGLRLWKPGESTNTTGMFIEDFRDYGIAMFTPTPHNIGYVTVFNNTRAGIGLLGSWGGTVNIDNISCDDNSSIIESIYGYDQEAGGTLNIGSIKLETGVKSETLNPWRGQIIARMFGQFALNIGAISAAAGAIKTDALFVVDPKISNGSLQTSHIHVGTMKGFNYSTIVQDIYNQKRWPSRGNFKSHGFEWTSEEGGKLTIRGSEQASSPCTATDRLGFLRDQSASFDYQKNEPKYYYIIDGSNTTDPTDPPAVTSVTVLPEATQIDEREQMVINATAQGTGDFDSSVSWQASSGVITAEGQNTAVYLAPDTDVDQDITIRATSNHDTSVFHEVTIKVINVDEPLSVDIVQNNTTIDERSDIQLSAIVSGSGNFNPNIVWSITSGGGSLSEQNGPSTTYSAPEVNQDSTAIIRASSAEDQKIFDEITIVVKNVNTPPPSNGSQISPTSLGVVVNLDDPTSQKIANEYVLRWGIPASNIVPVRLGNNPDLTSTSTLNTARNTIASEMPNSVQFLALCFQTPSRVISNSITWAITMGYAAISNRGNLPKNPMYGYAGKTPYTDLGIRPSALVYSEGLANNGRTSHAKKPSGTSYMLAANDQSGQPRGRSRLSQMQALSNNTSYLPIKMDFSSNLNGNPGEGPANNILNKNDMLMYWNGMYKIYGMDTNAVIKGAVGDYVTSTSGNLPTGLGQTPITYLTDNGFVGTMGTVVEPWQSGAGMSSGGLVEQFTNIETFVPLYRDGHSLVDAYWKSIKWPTRSLILCDPLCAPFGEEEGGGQQPILGCTDPNAINFDPNATVNDGSCQYDSSDPSVIASYEFGSDSSPELIKASVGGKDLTQPEIWRRAKIMGGKMIVDNYNVCYDLEVENVKKIKFYNITFKSNGYNYINDLLRIKPNGTIAFAPTNQTIFSGVVLDKAYDELTIEFPSPQTVAKMCGAGGQNNNAAFMEVDKIEFLK